MKKIISLFQRNYDTDKLVRNEVVPGAEWVLAGEGVATRKFDGTCCMVRDGKLFKRCEVRRGGKPPANFEPATGVDETTGKQQGWVPVGDGPDDCWHRAAMENLGADGTVPIDGFYELCGPKVQGNQESYGQHVLIAFWVGGQSVAQEIDAPRDFDGIKAFLTMHDIEGIVWHHSDGRMVKIKAKDFGIKRNV